MKRKFLLAMSLVVILSIIATTLVYLDKYSLSKDAMTKKYSKEIENSLTLEDNQKIIRIVRDDLNKDNIDDYIVLYGVENQVTSENLMETDSNQNLQQLTTTLDIYTNVGVAYVDNNNNELLKYETNKEFNGDVDLNIVKDEQGKYIFVNDSNSCNMALIKWEDNQLKDLVQDSFGNDFYGYTFTSEWIEKEKVKNAEGVEEEKELEKPKLNIELDTIKPDYLPENKEKYTLEFSNDKINSQNYRNTYMANKFNTFEINNEATDGKLRVVATQNILYLNKVVEGEKLPKTAGKINITFTLEGDKLTYDTIAIKE